MDSQTKAATPTAASFLPLREREIEAFANLMPLEWQEYKRLRVFNIWGDQSVGKTAFIRQLRESDLMRSKRVLWVQPNDRSSIGTIEEFIAAASKGVRYPAHPEKEKDISSDIESVQRGKINPMVSDDSILISRSKLATNKKPYVNQAAAASVGRTPYEREEMEVSVGLGENKADNQAEGFLEALPLQSLGTDLIVLRLGRLDQFADSIVDWIKNYLIPAASRGPYRRNLVILVESDDPLQLGFIDGDWGEWSDRLGNFRLEPAAEDAVLAAAAQSGLDPNASRFVYVQSLGYPGSVAEEIRRAQGGGAADIGPWADSLSDADQLRLAALCLPRKLYPDELDAIFGNHLGNAALTWLQSLPAAETPAEADGGKAYALSREFRQAALAGAYDREAFQPFKDRFLPYGRFARNVPSKASRLKLLMLSPLNWIDHECCAALFENQAAKVEEFLEKEPRLFIRREGRFRVSERIRDDLQAVADNMGSAAAAAIREKAAELWAVKRERLEKEIEEMERTIKETMDEVHRISRKQNETEAYLRVMEKKARATHSSVRQDGEKPYGAIAITLFVAAIGLFVAGQSNEYPGNLGFLIGSIAALCSGLGLLPSWSKQRKARLGAGSPSSVHLRQENVELSRQHQSMEGELADLQRAHKAKQRLLQFSYV